MKQGLSQSVRMGQELRINPRLYQAMDMLTMPLLDLQQHLKQELQQNPFLELVEPDEDDNEDEQELAAPNEQEDDTARENESTKTDAEDSPWEEYLLEGMDEGSSGLGTGSAAVEFTEPVRVETRDLSDHLRDQVGLLELNERQQLLAEEFVGNINEDGYLTCTLEELLAGVNELITKHADRIGYRGDAPLPLFTMTEAEGMLTVIQGLDPPGVGARDVRECLLIQLREAEKEGSLAYSLVRDSFDELIARKWTELARRHNIEPVDVQHAADEVAKLDPKPGARFNPSEEGFVIPDLIVDKIDGEYRVFTNDAPTPRLRLSKAYQDLARGRRQLDPSQREFIQSRLNAAHWLVQAIEQRRQTMLKVMHFIVDRQREFFDKGVEYLKPMTLREVADVVGLHESTVSRVTSDKYVQTPRGVLPLKFFFSSALSTTDGEDVSARGIRAQIQRLVNEEDSKRPLTDQEIVEVLKKGGINIARRTVAKYREQLNVLPARMRKRI